VGVGVEELRVDEAGELTAVENVVNVEELLEYVEVAKVLLDVGRSEDVEEATDEVGMGDELLDSVDVGTAEEDEIRLLDAKTLEDVGASDDVAEVASEEIIDVDETKLLEGAAVEALLETGELEDTVGTDDVAETASEETIDDDGTKLLERTADETVLEVWTLEAAEEAEEPVEEAASLEVLTGTELLL